MAHRQVARLCGTFALSLGLVTMARAAPELRAVLEHQGSTRPENWFGAYLLEEGDPESKILTTVRRGTRLTVKPDRSNDRYYRVAAKVRGKRLEGYVWKEFVRIIPDGQGPGRQRVGVAARSTEGRLGHGPVKGKAAKPKVKPKARPRDKASPAEEEETDDAGSADEAYQDTSAAAEREALVDFSRENAAQIKKIRYLKDRIEKELEVIPAGPMSAESAQRVDRLVDALDDLGETDQKLSRLLSSIYSTIQRHEKALKGLQGQVAGGSQRGPDLGSDETNRLLEQIDILRKAVLRSIMESAATKAYTRKVDAIEQAILARNPDGIKEYYIQMAKAMSWRGRHGSRTPIGAGQAEVGAQVVGGASGADLDGLEERLNRVEKRLAELEARVRGHARAGTRPANEDRADASEPLPSADEARVQVEGIKPVARTPKPREIAKRVRVPEPSDEEADDEGPQEAPAPRDRVPQGLSPVEVDRLINARL